MKLIVGLGNPGDRYSDTRHNAGRRLVEFIAKHRGVSFSKKKSLEASFVTLDWEDHPATLAYPETFMNVSGNAVHALVRHFRVDPRKDLLVAVDDIALPLGRLRLRAKGSDGGHNGLKSIHQAFAGGEYPRLRLGIGRLSGAIENVEDYVLSPFGPAEKKVLKDVMEKGLEACRLWVSQPFSAVMNVVNQASHKG